MSTAYYYNGIPFCIYALRIHTSLQYTVSILLFLCATRLLFFLVGVMGIGKMVTQVLLFCFGACCCEKNISLPLLVVARMYSIAFKCTLSSAAALAGSYRLQDAQHARHTGSCGNLDVYNVLKIKRRLHAFYKSNNNREQSNCLK